MINNEIVRKMAELAKIVALTPNFAEIPTDIIGVANNIKPEDHRTISDYLLVEEWMKKAVKCCTEDQNRGMKPVKFEMPTRTHNAFLNKDLWDIPELRAEPNPANGFVGSVWGVDTYVTKMHEGNFGVHYASDKPSTGERKLVD